MTEWKEYKLGEIVTFQRGHDLPKDKMIDGDIPVAGSNGIIGYHNQFTKDGPGVTIGRSGNIGIPHYYPNAYWAHNTVLYIVDFKGNDAKFMYYLLKTFDFTQLNAGSAVPSLNRNHIHGLHVSIPDVPTQRRIAAILSSLDDKIDLLHRENATLEQMAETLFRQWIVEEAKEEWEEKSLKQVVDIAIGRTPPRKESKWFSTNPNDIKWLSIKDMGGDSVFLFNTTEYLTKEAVEVFSIPIIPKSTVVLSFKMTVGRVGITTEDMLSNEAIAHFKFNDNTPFSKEYLYLFLKNYRYDTLGSTSSIVTAINSTMIKNMEIVIPDADTMERFKNQTQPVFDKIYSNQEQINTLVQTRDGLLPKLMSNEINI